MSKKRTNPVTKFIASQLGLVTQEEVDAKVKRIKPYRRPVRRAAEPLAVIPGKGIPQKNRPKQRQSMVIGQAVPPERKAEDYLAAYIGWVFRCTQIISEAAADIDLTLYTRKGQNEFDIVEAHPALDLLYKVNPLYTSYLIWEATAAYTVLTGECYWWLVGPVDNPTEIWPLRPDWVTVHDSKDKMIDHYEYGPPGDTKIKIPFEQVVPFKDFNPRNVYRGYGTVRAAAKMIDENEYQQDYSRSFYYNSALPGGALMTDQTLDDDQYDRVRDDWNAQHRGRNKAWNIAILEAGLKWQDVGITNKEMDYVVGRKLTRDEVIGMFGVPKALITSDDVNRAAAKEGRAILAENVIRPKMQRIVSFLNEFLLPRYGDDTLFFGFKDPVPNDDQLTLQRYDNALRHGWMTRNEVREQENLQPLEGADTLLVPFSVQDIGADRTPQDKEAQKKLTMRKNIHNVRIQPYSFLNHTLDKFTVRMANAIERFLEKATVAKRKNVPSENPMRKVAKEGEVVSDKEDDRVGHWKTLITRTDPREARYKHLLTELFQDQQDRVNAAIDQGITKKAAGKIGKIKTTPDDIENLVMRDTDVFAAPLMDFVRSIIEAEGIQQIQNLVDNALFYMQTPQIQKYLKKEGVKFIAGIQEETASQLRMQLSEAIEKQEGIPQIKARVEQVYEAAKGYRAERIARSEVIRATNFSTEQAYIQSKVVAKKEWLTAKDEATCPWCIPMDGKQIDLGENYFDEGDTIIGTNDKGKKVRLKVGIADIQYPPLHPNCRCTLIPVIASDDEKSMSKKALLQKLTTATLEEINKIGVLPIDNKK